MVVEGVTPLFKGKTGGEVRQHSLTFPHFHHALPTLSALAIIHLQVRQPPTIGPSSLAQSTIVASKGEWAKSKVSSVTLEEWADAGALPDASTGAWRAAIDDEQPRT